MYVNFDIKPINNFYQDCQHNIIISNRKGLQDNIKKAF